jgi:hypothetical protein
MVQEEHVLSYWFTKVALIVKEKRVLSYLVHLRGFDGSGEARAKLPVLLKLEGLKEARAELLKWL